MKRTFAFIASLILIPSIALAQYRNTPTSQPVLDASVSSPRWPAGVRFVFDTFIKLDKPDWTYPGCVPLATEGGQSAPFLFVGGWEGPKVELVDAHVRSFVKNAAARDFHVIAYDQETWARDVRVSADADIENSNRWYRRLFQLSREGDPKVLVGAYMSINRSYWEPIHYQWGMEALARVSQWTATEKDRWAANHVSKDGHFDPAAPAVIAFQQWTQSNERLGYGYDANHQRDDTLGAFDAADMLFADCYLMYNRVPSGAGTEEDDIRFDRMYLQHNIQEAKRVAALNGDKPVVVFMMPWLIETAKGEDPTISDNRWNAMLDVIVEQNVHLAIWNHEQWGPHQAYFERKFEMALDRVARPHAVATTRPATRPADALRRTK